MATMCKKSIHTASYVYYNIIAIEILATVAQQRKLG